MYVCTHLLTYILLTFIPCLLSIFKLARHQLLRCYLDQGEAGKARQLLEKIPTDSTSCFAFSRALIEHISCTVLQEPGSSETLRDAELVKGACLTPILVRVYICVYIYEHTFQHNHFLASLSL